MTWIDHKDVHTINHSNSLSANFAIKLFTIISAAESWQRALKKMEHMNNVSFKKYS
jgi:hypothetical protein